MITRRTLTATGLAVAATQAFAQRKTPLVIAHRGASGERPEHTLMGYILAIDEGADFIEPDLVCTQDGHLVVRHENEIAGTTDVAGRPEFAGRKATKTIDGAKVTGWFTEDFTLAELKSLRCRERLPQLRPGSARFDGLYAIPTYQEVIDLAKAEGRRVGRTIGTYPEMKHPTYFASIGLPIEGRLLDALKRNDLNTAAAPVFVQCFEVEPLKSFHSLGGRARRVMLVSQGVAPVDVKSAAGLKAIAAFAEGLGPEWPLVVGIDQAAEGGVIVTPRSLVGDAQAAGLAVHPWTVRAENAFLPTALRNGSDPAVYGDYGFAFLALFASGVDGVFSDFPGLAVEARSAFLKL